MNIIVICEESQEVCKAFRAKGHEAYSCDIQECSGGHPEWHLQGDALIMLKAGILITQNCQTLYIEKWDMIIAHPPCTYLSNAGACRMYPTKGNICNDRLKKAIDAKNFFMKILNWDVDKIIIENPLPLTIVDLPKATQVIQPYQFGHPYSKKTLLWIKGLPILKHTEVLDKWKPFIASGTSRNKGLTKGQKFAHGSKQRSKTFTGIAAAMAEQWG